MEEVAENETVEPMFKGTDIHCFDEDSIGTLSEKRLTFFEILLIIAPSVV